MANSSTIGFGLRPIKKVGQNDNNEGLTEYNVAAASNAMFQNDGVVATATGDIAIGAAGNTLIGSLNGVFFTDSNTSKPTYANHLLAANAATDIVAFVNDDPYQMFEVRSNAAGASLATDVFNNADMAVTAGVANVNGLSRSTLNDATLTGGGGGSAQLKIVGISIYTHNKYLKLAGTNRIFMNNQKYLKETATI
jgi:hypothetical protein